MKDPERKSTFTIIQELIILLFVYKEIPVHYFSRYLFKKEVTNFRDYVPNKFFDKKIKPFFNDRSVKDVLDNKLFFDMFYSKFDIRLPKIIMFNDKKVFVIGNKVVVVNNVAEFESLLNEIFAQNASYESIFIKKTNSSSSGNHIYKLLRSDLAFNKESIYGIFTEVYRSEYLFQETIMQHPALIALNPSCLNTIRLDTFTDQNGNIEVISAYLRMSISNLCVDNISSGGCSVGINLDNGTLKKVGHSSIHIAGATVFKEHPLTKTVFENFKIPFFNQVMELAIKTASLMPGLRMVGWDIAIGESEPFLIEGNWDYDITGNDEADGGYLANPVFRKVLHEVNYL